MRKRSGAVDSLTNTSSGCGLRNGSDASTRFNASLTEGINDEGSTADRITNATGTPKLLFCAQAM
jgi:hypothetical protein